MPKEKGTYKIKEVAGEVATYEVESWSDPRFDNRVDLLADPLGNGECNCVDYCTRCVPNQKKNPGVVVPYYFPRTKTLNPDRTQCKHIEIATVYFLKPIIPELAKRYHERRTEEAERRMRQANQDRDEPMGEGEPEGYDSGF